jgi:hypothetical protein
MGTNCVRLVRAKGRASHREKDCTHVLDATHGCLIERVVRRPSLGRCYDDQQLTKEVTQKAYAKPRR